MGRIFLLPITHVIMSVSFEVVDTVQYNIASAGSEVSCCRCSHIVVVSLALIIWIFDALSFSVPLKLHSTSFHSKS